MNQEGSGSVFSVLVQAGSPSSYQIHVAPRSQATLLNFGDPHFDALNCTEKQIFKVQFPVGASNVQNKKTYSTAQINTVFQNLDQISDLAYLANDTLIRLQPRIKYVTEVQETDENTSAEEI